MNGHDATWVDDAVAVTLTAQRGTPWIMLRHELYETLAKHLAATHKPLLDPLVQELEVNTD